MQGTSRCGNEPLSDERPGGSARDVRRKEGEAQPQTLWGEQGLEREIDLVCDVECCGSDAACYALYPRNQRTVVGRGGQGDPVGRQRRTDHSARLRVRRAPVERAPCLEAGSLTRVTDYVLLANARVLAHALVDQLAARRGTSAGDRFLQLVAGDRVVPVFQSTAGHGSEDLESLKRVTAELGLDFEDVMGEYSKVASSVPYVFTVNGSWKEKEFEGQQNVVVPVQAQTLPQPVPLSEFLRLRTLPDATAAQFMTFTPTRGIQEIDKSVVDAIRSSAVNGRDAKALFREYTLVQAQNVRTAEELLRAAGRGPRDGDAVFLFTRAAMPGVAKAESGHLVEPQQTIARPPEANLDLLFDAQLKATGADPFNATPAVEAVERLIGMFGRDEKVLPLDDYSAFYPYRQLNTTLTQALNLSKRPMPPQPDTELETTLGSDSQGVAAALQGLSVEAVLSELPDGFSIDRQVVAAAVASLRAGKHLLLGGPPGSGKTTLAEALCRAVVGVNYDVTTATADWTTFDTIGGYLPDNDGLKFVPGVVLRSLENAGWLIIDEVNRADIDKAFGPLFTVLSGGEGSSGRTSVLPYSTPEGTPITIKWTEASWQSDGVYPLNATWRLIGTLNLSDKSSLFRLSFAFLRRFAVIDVPLPDEDSYRALFVRWYSILGREDVENLVALSMRIVTGPVAIGPAIAYDLVRLVAEGLLDTASGTPIFASDSEAMLTAIRLLIVPQYEGQPLASGKALLLSIQSSMEAIGGQDLDELANSFKEVSLS